MNHIILKDCEDLYKERTMDWSRLKNASEPWFAAGLYGVDACLPE